MGYELVNADCLDHIRTMADDSVDMTITSPPYTDQRTYGIAFKLSGQGWVDWCAERIVEMCRVTAGIVFFNAAGPVRDFQYQPVVEWLVADLTRKHGIVCGPAPYVFHRVGIPGSGGPHYHRRDWESIYCFAKPASLPPRWSDNTATGHPPKWAPGGEMSYRNGDGSRRNQWGGNHASGGRTKEGEKKNKGDRPSHQFATNKDLLNGKKIDGGRGSKAVTRRKANGLRGEPAGTATSGHADGDTQTQDGIYLPPVIANSGNVIQCQLSIDELWSMILHYANTTKTSPDQVLRFLQEAINTMGLCRWLQGIDFTILGASFLRTSMYGSSVPRTESNSLPWMPPSLSSVEEYNQVLQSKVHGGCESEMLAARTSDPDGAARGQKQDGQDGLFRVRSDDENPRPPRGQESDEQRHRESESSLPNVSHKEACQVAGNLSNLWEASEAVQALWHSLRQALPAIQAAWRSLFESDRVTPLPTSYSGGRIIHCKVGGGQMGSPIAHESEAPFPEKLARFFIISYCREGGTVLDPFCGSGTSVSVAVQENRNAIGIDIRDGKGGLASARKRLGTVTPAGLFEEIEP